MLTISAAIGIILFILNYFNRFIKTDVFELLKKIVVNIFALSLLPSWICEKIKATKILKALVEDWDIDNLYESVELKFEKYQMGFLILNFSMYFMLQIYIITASIDISEMTYTFVMFLFFINVLRFNLRFSENTIFSKIMYLEYFVDLFTIMSFTIMTRFFIPNVFMIKIIIFCNVLNLISNTYTISKSKNILESRKRSRKKNNKRR